jgi:hypothetical protein
MIYCSHHENVCATIFLSLNFPICLYDFLKMDTKQWFHLSTGQFGYPQPEKDFGYLNQTYDINNACPTCNIGLRQANEFRFKSEPKASNSQFIDLNWVFDQIFLRQPIEEIFLEETVTGISFSIPVFNKTGKPLETIKQLRVDTIIVDGLITDNLKIEICEYPKEKSQIKFLTAIGSRLIKGPFCGQIKFNYPQRKSFEFRKNSFSNMPDIIRTVEWFGSGGSASRPIFISYKVYEIIKRFKWRGAFLEPVKFI